MNAATVEILSPGMSTTIQDAGRRGFEQWGVTVSGAMDRRSMRRANQQLGNADGSPALESLLGGLELRLSGDRWCSVAGAPAIVTVAGESVPDPLLFWAPAGERVRIATPRYGMYTYLALAGGVRPERVLGSVSTDTLSGIGPAVLAAGDLIPLGDPGSPIWDTDAPSPAIPRRTVDIAFIWGPRDDLFPDADRARLIESEWTVSPDTNRIGARLVGATLAAGSGSMPSEGVVRGSIQIPPSGKPIVFLADHPVTGGYPVIGVLREHDQDLISQAAPGTRIRFRSTHFPSSSLVPSENDNRVDIMKHWFVSPRTASASAAPG